MEKDLKFIKFCNDSNLEIMYDDDFNNNVKNVNLNDSEIKKLLLKFPPSLLKYKGFNLNKDYLNDFINLNQNIKNSHEFITNNTNKFFENINSNKNQFYYNCLNNSFKELGKLDERIKLINTNYFKITNKIPLNYDDFINLYGRKINFNLEIKKKPWKPIDYCNIYNYEIDLINKENLNYNKNLYNAYLNYDKDFIFDNSKDLYLDLF